MQFFILTVIKVLFQRNLFHLNYELATNLIENILTRLNTLSNSYLHQFIPMTDEKIMLKSQLRVIFKLSLNPHVVSGFGQKKNLNL